MDTSYESIKVNLDVNPNDLLDNAPEKIVNLLIGVSQRAEKCFDFQISAWLEKYETVRKQPNFAEAGLLIYSASQIYSRKMNFFEKMVYQLAANSKNKEDYKDIDQTNMVSRRGNKLRNSTIVDSLDEAEFFVREFDHVPNVKFTELIKKKNFEFNSYWEKFKHSQCRFLKNKKNKLFISKKNSIDNSELIVTNAGLEKNHICDYDGEDIVGTKADFRCFSYIFNDKFQLVSDYNFNRYFKQVDLVNEMHKHQQEVQSKIKRKDYIRFKFYISNDYLKNTYDIELTKNINGEMECNHSTDLNITDLVNSKSTTESASYDLNTSAKSSVACDSAYQSVLSTNYTLDRRTTEKNDFFSASIFGENSDKELTECNLHDEHDEGISIRSFSIQSPINMSETGSEINLDMKHTKFILD
ncbi:uncharacterized protein LOC134835656 isoform X2 [Culicoides brevitarsis]|uniref:uncharacterized protein LOC134835656 isoform X2 n=1 Tax=Culicoides brevitarsis TaxID=469753 RepID=UPI00307B810B